LGATRAIADATVGKSLINYFGYFSGLEYSDTDFTKMLGGALIPRDTYFRHKDTEWMK